MEDEVWLPVPGYEGWYEVSNFARVRSVDRLVTYFDGSKMPRKGKVLSPGKKHHSVMLGRNGERTYFNPVALMNAAFLGYDMPKGLRGARQFVPEERTTLADSETTSSVPTAKRLPTIPTLRKPAIYRFGYSGT